MFSLRALVLALAFGWCDTAAGGFEWSPRHGTTASCMPLLMPRERTAFSHCSPPLSRGGTGVVRAAAMCAATQPRPKLAAAQSASSSAKSRFFGLAQLSDSLRSPLGSHGLPPLRCPTRLGQRSVQWTCRSYYFADDDQEGDWETEPIVDMGDEDDRLVILRDTKADRVIECFVDR